MDLHVALFPDYVSQQLIDNKLAKKWTIMHLPKQSFSYDC